MEFPFAEKGQLWAEHVCGLLGTGAVRSSVLDVKFEMPIRCPRGGVEEAVGYKNPASQAGQKHTWELSVMGP